MALAHAGVGARLDVRRARGALRGAAGHDRGEGRAADGGSTESTGPGGALLHRDLSPREVRGTCRSSPRRCYARPALATLAMSLAHRRSWGALGRSAAVGGRVACGHTGAAGAGHLDAPDLSGPARAEWAAGEPLILTVGGRERAVLVHLPRETDGRVPLVLSLHGSRFARAEQKVLAGMDAASGHAASIVAHPRTAIPSGTGFEWDIPDQPLLRARPAPADAPDDVEFLAAWSRARAPGLRVGWTASGELLGAGADGEPARVRPRGQGGRRPPSGGWGFLRRARATVRSRSWRSTAPPTP